MGDRAEAPIQAAEGWMLWCSLARCSRGRIVRLSRLASLPIDQLLERFACVSRESLGYMRIFAEAKFDKGIVSFVNCKV